MKSPKRQGSALLWRVVPFLLVIVLALSACANGNAQEGEGTVGAPTEMGQTQPAVGVETPVEQATEVTGETPAAEETPAETAVMEETPTGAAAAETGTPEGTEAAIPETGEGAVEVDLELVAEGFASPLVFLPDPAGGQRFFVADQTGQIYIIDEQGQRMDEPFLDLSDRMVDLDEGYDERGLLGLAFHPDYAENGRFFVYYSAPLRADAPQDWDHTSHISEFQVSADDENRADPESERIIMEVDQPQSNHNGGQITFGPDGYLYIPLGDGGGADDVDVGHVEDWYDANQGGNGQDITDNLLGSILRIDVDNGDPYGIPEDNPFVDSEPLDEIYAYGLRNPYRIAFDTSGDQALYAGDAGQALYEEVSIIEAGGNYGWNVKEGTSCFNAANNEEALDECPDETPDGEALIDPVIEFQNTATFEEEGLGNTVIGGNVYHGSAIPELDGRYVFGVWSTSFTEADGAVFVATPQEGEGVWPIEPVSITSVGDERFGEYLLSFGVDQDGEMYILTTEEGGPSGETGKVYRLVPAGEGGGENGSASDGS